MSYNPTFTNAGLALLIKAMSGESLTFTKMQIGNGNLAEGEDIKALTTLKNPIMDISINRTERNENNVVIVGNKYTNSNLEQDISWNELGIFAKGNDNIERLFAVMNSERDIEFIPNSNSSVPVENTIAVSLIISQSVNVSAVVKSIQYCTVESFEEHLQADNPHGLDKVDIGLEKVENEYFSDNKVDFYTGQKLRNFTTGATLKTIVSKLWALINDYLSHLENNRTVNCVNLVITTSNIFNVYLSQFYVKNGIAYICMTFQINKALGQDQGILVAKLPSKMSPLSSIAVIGQTNLQGDNPTVSIQINSDGSINLYSFGYENLPWGTFIRFQATYPVS